MKATVVVLVVCLALAFAAPVVEAIESDEAAFLPDDCANVNWLSPSQAFGCIAAILGKLFTGWSGWEVVG